MGRKKRAGLGLILERFSLKATKATGTSGAFVVALAVLIVWGISSIEEAELRHKTKQGKRRRAG